MTAAPHPPITRSPDLAGMTLDAARIATAQITELEATKFQYALLWAHLHPGDHVDPTVPWHERELEVAGDGAPTVAEFAMVALLFFTILIGIVEFGRLLYTHNALTDATRAGARYGSIHHGATDADKLAVKNYVVYGPNGTFDVDGNATSPPVIANLTTDMVTVDFEGVDEDGDPATPGNTAYGTNLGSVTVSIENYQFNLNIPLIARTLTLPEYTTTSMAESAGEEPGPIVTP